MRHAWLGITALLVTAHARADILPTPMRPEWDTPVPMPPEAALAVLVVLAAFVARALARAR